MYHIVDKNTVREVALFTRAWIEIASGVLVSGKLTVALFTRAWIEIFKAAIVFDNSMGRPLHEGVD